MMKKQILFLTFFVLATFAGMTDVYGQNLTASPTCPTVTPITCQVDGALNPMPGKEYTYTVAVPTPIGTKTYNWFVTTDTDFIDATTGLTTDISVPITGAHIAAVGTGTGGTYNNATSGGTATIQLTWKSFTFDPANPVFLVIYVQNAEDCTTDNLEVFIIEPVHSFTLDIAKITAAGGAWTATTPDDCVSPIVSAAWDAVNSKVAVDYGENYLYFAVSAANFSHSWLPTFELTGVTGTATLLAVDWAYPDASYTGATTITWNATTASGDIYTSSTPVLAKDASGTVGAGGECIVVRVLVDHNTDEAIAAIPVSLAVDGIMYDPAAVAGSGSEYSNSLLGDIHYAANPTGNVCPWYDGYTNDVVVNTLSPRPDINEDTPTGFETKDR